MYGMLYFTFTHHSIIHIMQQYHNTACTVTIEVEDLEDWLDDMIGT
jgi:hypothetical protein